MATKYESLKNDELARISIQELTDKVIEISSNDNFIAPSSMTDAIIQIVAIIQNSYDEYDRDIENPAQQILLIIQKRPVSPRYRETSKSSLAEKPLLVQLLVLMQRADKDKRKHLKRQVIWLAIAMHTAVVLYHHNKKTLANNILMQFKLAIFFTTSNRVWIWNELSDYQLSDSSDNKLYINNVLTTLAEIAERIEQELTTIANRSAHSLIEKKLDPHLKDKSSQISKILKAYERAHYPNIKKKRKTKKKKDRVEAFNDKPIKLSNELIDYSPSNEPAPYQWDTQRGDIEHLTPNITATFLEPEVEESVGLASSFEEIVDSYDTPYINYQQLPNPLIRHSAPLQSIDLSVQQNYISQRELALNSNMRLLSLAGYQILFGALAYDTRDNQMISETNSICAGILLLSMITALPVDSLMITGYIEGSRVFQIGDKRAYIQHRLGITERAEVFDENKHENKLDVIKLPVPIWLVEQLLAIDMPIKENMTAYIKSLRQNYAFPYLSLARIESALHVILSRYTSHSSLHIANIICRIPAPQAPAMYYSSHSSEALISHYKSGLMVLNADDNLDLSYIKPWHKYTTGSGFALTLEYVREFIKDLKQWVNNSIDEEEHFDRTSLYTWFVFCLLTGIRPNNGIGKISDLDLNVGWLLIDDKPNKSSRSHRLVPLCATLVQHLKSYQNYLIDYQLKHLSKQNINETVDHIRAGDDIALLRLLSEGRDKMIIIKRGAVYQMTKELIDMNPYWTRHFVRTQLERAGIEIALINGVIGHEKNRQEALGRFSTLSKQQLKSVGKAFEEIAERLELSGQVNLAKRFSQG